MKSIRFYLLNTLFVFLAVHAGYGYASDATADKQIIRLSTVPEFKPFIVAGKNGGQPRGIDVDVVNEMCRRMDVICKLEFHPWKRVLSRIEDGKSNGGFSGFRTPEREAYAHFIPVPLHYSTYNIFVKSGDEFDFSTIEDLYGKTIGIHRGFKISPELSQAADLGRITIQEVNSLEQNIKKLLAGGRIDAVAANYHKMRLKLVEKGQQCDVSCLPVPITPPRPSYLMISKKWINQENKGLLNRMTTVLQSMYDDGTIDDINSSYLD